MICVVFCFKQKTAYEMRISDWSSDVCSSDLDHCGGRPSGITRAGTPPTRARTIRYDPVLSETLGGLAIPADRQQAILESLGFTVDSDWTVTVPSWRRDVDGAADLVEEVIRIEIGRAHV